MIARYTGGRTLQPGATLEELGLSSLERVELMVALEEALDSHIDESAFAGAKTVDDLRQLAVAPAQAERPAEPVEFPRWTRSWPVRLVRNLSQSVVLLPLARLFAWIAVQGVENLRDLDGPVIFASNHQSHMDTPVILAALPRRIRTHVSTAMAKEFFKAHFFPQGYSRREWFTNSLNYWLSAAFFNTFPLPQREAGARQTLKYAGELVSSGHSVLIFPEGKRTEHGRNQSVQTGSRDDGVEAWRPCRAGAAGRSRSRPAPHMEDGEAGPGAGEVRRADAFIG